MDKAIFAAKNRSEYVYAEEMGGNLGPILAKLGPINGFTPIF